MKIICTQENLMRGLNIVSHIAGKNVSLPILNNILVKAEGNQVSLVSTNLDIGIKTNLRGKVEEVGELTVQAKLFADYVNLLSSGNIEMKKDGDNLKVSTDTQESIIKGQGVDEYPIVPDLSNVEGLSLETVQFKDALNQVISSASYDDIRPELSGVYFKITDGELNLVATDSYRLAEKKLLVNGTQKIGEIEKIIPLRVLQEVVRVLGDGYDDIEVGFSDNQVVFKLNGTTIISRLIEGNYPDYKEIIPKEWKTRVMCDKSEMVKLVKTVSLFTKTGINDVLLEFDKSGEVKISAANVQLGESKSSLKAEIEGENNSVVFNYKYLLEGLANVGNKKVVIEMSSSDAPVLIKPEGDKSYLYLIMPIRR